MRRPADGRSGLRMRGVNAPLLKAISSRPTLLKTNSTQDQLYSRPTLLKTNSTQDQLYSRPWRYALGESPVVLRNAAENELVSANPTASAIPVIDRAGSTSKVLARSMRRPT